MSFIDKVKAGVKSGAEMAATKAQAEYERVQVRRELADAYESLGVKTFELVEQGGLSHAELTPLAEQVRAAKTKLDTIGKEQPAATAEPVAEQSQPAAEEPPAAT